MILAGIATAIAFASGTCFGWWMVNRKISWHILARDHQISQLQKRVAAYGEKVNELDKAIAEYGLMLDAIDKVQGTGEDR